MKLYIWVIAYLITLPAAIMNAAADRAIARLADEAEGRRRERAEKREIVAAAHNYVVNQCWIEE